uniref:Tetratricopeptide repeat domain 7A n=1 Tax=Labrus bergylta TaxID=56723 RepID=A0A3Q3F0R2_9LABR
MAARVSFTQIRLETEVERCRAECQWDRMPTDSNKVRFSILTPLSDDYGMLLMAEALLEECLQENTDLLRSCMPLTDKTQPKLCRAKGHLNSVLSRGRLSPRYLNEALLLMAKVHYVQGRYRDAQGMCARVGLEELTQDVQPTYHLRLLAEAFVIKGTRHASCFFFLSSIPFLVFLLFHPLSPPHPIFLPILVSPLPPHHLPSSSHPRLVPPSPPLPSFLPHPLLSFSTFSLLLLMVLLLLLPLFVLFPVSSSSFFFLLLILLLYPSPPSLPPFPLSYLFLLILLLFSLWSFLFSLLLLLLLYHFLCLLFLVSLSSSPSPPPPLPSASTPLLLSHRLPPSPLLHHSDFVLYQASGEAVISRLPDQAEARKTSLQDATSVYDLLTIGMARRGQYAMLSECLERAMKFSFNEFHLWHQLGLSLMAAGKGVGAVSVFKECSRMRPEDPSLPLLAAKVCIGQLHWFEEAEALSKTVMSMGEEAREFLPRAYLSLGLSCSLQASDGKHLDLISFLENTAGCKCYLSCVWQVSAALEPLQAALSLRGDDVHSLHLLTLLLSAQKHHRHAMDTMNLALSQHPGNFNLLFTKVKLEEVLFGPAAALQTCEEMLQSWQSRYDVSRSSIPMAERVEVSAGGRKPSIFLTLPDFQDASTGSQSPSSVAATRLEAALSEVSDLSSTPRQGPTYIWTTLERIWLQAGELFMADGRLKEAQFCIAEASALFPNSHSVLLQRGRLASCGANWMKLKACTTRRSPSTPRERGHLLVKTERVHLGEKVLRDAVQVHSTSHEAWSGLGEALQSRGSIQAPECFLTALELEASCPIRPFAIIPREL